MSIEHFIPLHQIDMEVDTPPSRSFRDVEGKSYQCRYNSSPHVVGRRINLTLKYCNHWEWTRVILFTKVGVYPKELNLNTE